MDKDLYLITGFLGSGKTTFLKNMLCELKGKKAAVILNEYGQKSVDDVTIGDDINKTVIENGSIFCTCRSDKFIDALARISSYDFDPVLVESSGLSDPRSINKLMETANKVSDCRYIYKGMITVVSAVDFLKLADIVNVIPSQIVNSSIIIINKTDLSDMETIDKIRKKIAMINNKAVILEAVYAAVDLDRIFNDIIPNEELFVFIPHIKDLSFQKEYKEFSCVPDLPELRSYLEDLSPRTYRIKGFVKTKEGSYSVDCVGEEINITLMQKDPEKSFVVILGKNIDNEMLEII